LSKRNRCTILSDNRTFREARYRFFDGNSRLSQALFNEFPDTFSHCCRRIKQPRVDFALHFPALTLQARTNVNIDIEARLGVDHSAGTSEHSRAPREGSSACDNPRRRNRSIIQIRKCAETARVVTDSLVRQQRALGDSIRFSMPSNRPHFEF